MLCCAVKRSWTCSLVNKSLVAVDDSGSQPRYSLSNTIRQYAHEKLVEAGEFEWIFQRYLTYLPLEVQAPKQAHQHSAEAA
jgi:predicted ATPase